MDRRNFAVLPFRISVRGFAPAGFQATCEVARRYRDLRPVHAAARYVLAHRAVSTGHGGSCPGSVLCKLAGSRSADSGRGYLALVVLWRVAKASACTAQR